MRQTACLIASTLLAGNRFFDFLIGCPWAKRLLLAGLTRRRIPSSIVIRYFSKCSAFVGADFTRPSYDAISEGSMQEV